MAYYRCKFLPRLMLMQRMVTLSENQQRVAECFQPLENVINDQWMPVLSGGSKLVPAMRELFGLPVSMQGMGLVNLVECASENHADAQKINAVAVDWVHDHRCSDFNNAGNPIEYAKLLESLNKVKCEVHLARVKRHKDRAAELISNLVPVEVKERLSVHVGAVVGHQWKVCIPMTAFPWTMLNSIEYLDSIALYYGLKIGGLADTCVCGVENSVYHAKICKQGGAVVHRHDSLKGSIASSMKQGAFHSVEMECVIPSFPLGVFPVEKQTTMNVLARSDVQGVDKYGTMHVLDIAVIELSAVKYRGKPTQEALCIAEHLKIVKYKERIERTMGGSKLVPVVLSSDGHLGTQAKNLLCTIASSLVSNTSSSKSNNYATQLHQIVSRLSFDLARGNSRLLHAYRAPKPLSAAAQLKTTNFDLSLAGLFEAENELSSASSRDTINNS
jgi:hypothetical protein